MAQGAVHARLQRRGDRRPADHPRGGPRLGRCPPRPLHLPGAAGLHRIGLRARGPRERVGRGRRGTHRLLAGRLRRPRTGAVGPPRRPRAEPVARRRHLPRERDRARPALRRPAGRHDHDLRPGDAHGPRGRRDLPRPDQGADARGRHGRQRQLPRTAGELRRRGGRDGRRQCRPLGRAAGEEGRARRVGSVPRARPERPVGRGPRPLRCSAGLAGRARVRRALAQRARRARREWVPALDDGWRQNVLSR